jgi:hypothetical protein
LKLLHNFFVFLPFTNQCSDSILLISCFLLKLLLHLLVDWVDWWRPSILHKSRHCGMRSLSQSRLPCAGWHLQVD